MKIITNETEIQNKIKKVDGAMSQEGMPLTKELRSILYNCYIGKTTFDIERQKMIDKYIYEKTINYCYKDSDVLINKLNITDERNLYEAERDLVALRVAWLNEEPIKGYFDFKHLKFIHKFLFQDIYGWAGVIRNCNIAKQDLFCLYEYIESFANDIFSRLKKEKYFIKYSYEVKLEKLALLFANINALHPFREGNGRSQREFIKELAKINGIDLNLTTVSENDMIVASHDSINGHYEKLFEIFKKNSALLTEEERIYFIKLYCIKDLCDTLIY